MVLFWFWARSWDDGVVLLGTLLGMIEADMLGVGPPIGMVVWLCWVPYRQDGKVMLGILLG